MLSRGEVGGVPRSRRGFLKALGAGAVVAGAAAAGAGGRDYGDTASARARADSATVAELSSARSARVMWRADTTEKVMALTFDDGPGPTLTSPLLDLLREQRVRATFCLVGRCAHAMRDLVRRQMRDGHELANHTWSHPDLSLLEVEQLGPELERTDQLLYELTGRRPAVIRPPFGRVNGALLQHAAIARQDVLLWHLRFNEAVMTSAQNATYVLDNLGPGSILLGHDHGSDTRYVGVAAVPEIIRQGRLRGYEFVTASDMINRDRRA